MERREFLALGGKAAAFTLLEPGLQTGKIRKPNVIIDPDIGNLEARIIAAEVQKIRSKFNIGELTFEFINGNNMEQNEGATFYNLGVLDKFNDPDMVDYYNPFQKFQEEFFIDNFGVKKYEEYSGKSPIAIKDIVSIKKKYKGGKPIIRSVYLLNYSDETYYRKLVNHESAHHLLLNAGLAEALGALVKIQKTNGYLYRIPTIIPHTADTNLILKHPGHVSARSFLSFYDNNNSLFGASEQFAETLAYQMMGIDTPPRNPSLRSKNLIVRNFMLDNYT